MAQRPRFDRIWSSASANRMRDPGTQKYNTGWVSEIPTYQVLNFLQNKADLTFLANAERGVPEWGGDVNYVKSGIAWDEEVGKVFLALVPSPNKTLRPNKNSNQWVESAINIPRTDYDTSKKTMLDHVADVTSNPHKLTPAGLNAYTKAQVDSILNQYRALVDAHVKNVSNPHKTTAAQIGAVPVTGGAYTGLVRFSLRAISLGADDLNQFVTDSLGTWITQDKGRLGISTAGVGQVGVVGNMSPIITEQNFSDNKIKVEDSYAIPEPLFLMNAVRDANVQRGTGVWNATWDIQFAGDTGWMILATVKDRRDYLPSVSPLDGYVEATIAMQFRFRENVASDTGPTGNRQVVGFGNMAAANPARLIFLVAVVSAGSRYLSVMSGDTGNVETTKIAVPDRGLHTAVAVRRKDSHELWIDGVMVASKASVNTRTIQGTNNGISVSGVADTKSESRMEIANLRAWGIAMTPEQISRL